MNWHRGVGLLCLLLAGVRTLVATPAALSSGPLAYYVDTGAALGTSAACSQDYPQRFTGSGLQTEITRRAPGPIQYAWDAAAGRLRTERDQFGYEPRFRPGRVSFATNGRPMIRAYDGDLTLQVLGDDGTWSGVSLLRAAQDSLAIQGYSWRPAPGEVIADVSAESRVVYDRNCNAYALIDAVRSTMTTGSSTDRRSILLHSMDGGRRWAAYRIPDPQIPGVTDYAINMEVPAAGHVLEGPPALLLHPRGYADIEANRSPTPAEVAQRVTKLVTITARPDGTLTLAAPFTISSNSVSGAGIAGSENYAVSSGDLIHIVYPGGQIAQDPVTRLMGTPAYAVTYSRSGNRLCGAPVQIGVGVSTQNASVVDDHSQPVIARDTQGYLHVMIGGHNGPMYYRKSASPGSTAVWGRLETVGNPPTADPLTTAMYTYPSLVIDRADQPLVAARTSAGAQYAFTLVVLRRKADPPHWDAQKTLLHPGRTFYANWYHKLSLDSQGKVFVSYAYHPGVQLFTDEVTILEKTYGWTLKQLPETPACTPTTHDATPSQVCNFGGAQVVNFGVLVADLNQSWPNLQFELATSGSFAGLGVRGTSALPPRYTATR